MLFFASAAAASAQTARGEVLERTMAIVAGSAITLADVRTAMALQLIDTVDVNVATERLVERALILREVERYAPPEPNQERINARLQQIRRRTGDAQLAAILSSGGFSEARLIAWLRDDLRIAAYLDQRFAADGPERRDSLIADWIADLRRRTPVVELWKQ